MIRFLINRPVGVMMTILAFVACGIIVSFDMPVSLLPDIDLPEISVLVSSPGTPARDLEDRVVTGLREALGRTSGLQNIQSTTYDGSATIEMRFSFKADIDVCFIEVSEKLDHMMAGFPRHMKRPQIIKSSLSDMPVFKLSITQKGGAPGVDSSSLATSEFVEYVIKNRLEQIEEVAMVDISGLRYPMISIVPVPDRLQAFGISPGDLISAISSGNIEFGSIEIEEKEHFHSIRIQSKLNSIEDIRNINCSPGVGRLIRLSDVATITRQAQAPSGLSLFDHQEAIVLSVIKKHDARISKMEAHFSEALDQLKAEHPGLDFNVSQDYSEFLNFSIRNLKHSLLTGMAIASLILFIFIREVRSSLIIQVSLPVSVLISLLVMYMLGFSFNIISLSGLILGAGMMIDNSIIVVDNINHYISEGYDADQAIVSGTEEVIRPLLSSVLTTCAVFIPLIFLSDLAGALFFEQAITVSVCLFTSLLVSLFFIPVLHKILIKRSLKTEKPGSNVLFKAYSVSLKHAFRYQYFFLVFCLLLIPVGIYLFMTMNKQVFPVLKHTDLSIHISWDDVSQLDESRLRVMQLRDYIGGYGESMNSFIGRQEFYLTLKDQSEPGEATLWVKTGSYGHAEKVRRLARHFMDQHYPGAELRISRPDNPFDRLFTTEDALFVARVYSLNEKNSDLKLQVEKLRDEMTLRFPGSLTREPASKTRFIFRIRADRLQILDVTYDRLINKLRLMFGEIQAGRLQTSNMNIPLTLHSKRGDINDMLNKAFVESSDQQFYPLREFIEIRQTEEPCMIMSSKAGEYSPLGFQLNGHDLQEITTALIRKSREIGLYLTFHGTFVQARKLIREMIFIMIIAALMLYFILAAQFESLVQPFIVMAEILIDICGAVVMLLLFKVSVNLMSALGMVVMAGIIINDSILKIDTINRLRRQGMKLKDAIHAGGLRRVRPIIMTSLTTILAFVPLLFSPGLGRDLQAPLVIALGGGLIMGTLMSLYLIPVVYWNIYKSEDDIYK